MANKNFVLSSIPWETARAKGEYVIYPATPHQHFHVFWWRLLTELKASSSGKYFPVGRCYSFAAVLLRTVRSKHLLLSLYETVRT
jgi:hypothetical protein